MQYIETKLNDITSQHRLLVILFRSLNDDKVRKCVAKLDSSLEGFKVLPYFIILRSQSNGSILASP